MNNTRPQDKKFDIKPEIQYYKSFVVVAKKYLVKADDDHKELNAKFKEFTNKGGYRDLKIVIKEKRQGDQIWLYQSPHKDSEHNDKLSVYIGSIVKNFNEKEEGPMLEYDAHRSGFDYIKLANMHYHVFTPQYPGGLSQEDLPYACHQTWAVITDQDVFKRRADMKDGFIDFQLCHQDDNQKWHCSIYIAENTNIILNK